jgi:hypothetical protein
MPIQRDNDAETSIDIVRVYIAAGKKVPEDLKDDLLFGSLVALYDGVRQVRQEVRKMQPWVSIFKWILITVGPLVVFLLFGMLTHTFTWPF